MNPDGYSIGRARLEELPRLPPIEDAAGLTYASVGLPDDLEGLPPAEFVAAQRDGLLWVIRDSSDALAGFALCWRRPDALHLRELDVHPDHMRRGLGRRLIDHVRRVAASERRGQVTLTTFAEVPWNAPLYRRYGFTEVSPAAMPAWLAEIRETEAREGLDRWPRIAMSISAIG